MQKTNYQRELDKLLEGSAAKAPLLLLHSCCAPCSSYCLEYLREYFQITVFYYNPNITDKEEYLKRKEEELRLIDAYNRIPGKREIKVFNADYDPGRYLEAVKGLEQCPEGGERCAVCFHLRLEETAKKAAEGGFEYFCTTLTISPLKNAEMLNSIGHALGVKYGVPFLPSDFKKKGGYQRSIVLSGEYGLYRQDYCGCDFSKEERRRQKAEAQSKVF